MRGTFVYEDKTKNEFIKSNISYRYDQDMGCRCTLIIWNGVDVSEMT